MRLAEVGIELQFFQTRLFKSLSHLIGITSDSSVFLIKILPPLVQQNLYPSCLFLPFAAAKRERLVGDKCSLIKTSLFLNLKFLFCSAFFALRMSNLVFRLMNLTVCTFLPSDLFVGRGWEISMSSGLMTSGSPRSSLRACIMSVSSGSSWFASGRPTISTLFTRKYC